MPTVKYINDFLTIHIVDHTCDIEALCVPSVSHFIIIYMDESGQGFSRNRERRNVCVRELMCTFFFLIVYAKALPDVVVLKINKAQQEKATKLVVGGINDCLCKIVMLEVDLRFSGRRKLNVGLLLLI